MRILTFTTLYPNAARPNHGVFVENRLRHLVATGAVAARVIAPVPWFPFASPRFGEWGRWAQAPRQEVRHGLAVDHPRYVLPPKIGMVPAPLLLYAAVQPVLKWLLAEGHRFDLVDAHYFYPDGVAAALLAQQFGLPLVITGRGSDLTQIPNHALPRRMIQWAAGRAAGLITVCAALRHDLLRLGVPAEKVRVLRNGVDLDLFRPTARQAARARLRFDGPTLLYVGHLIPRKSQALVIRALALLPGVRLVLVGEGPDRRMLVDLAGQLGVSERVRFVGQVPHAELPELYSAADALVLTATREGWPNVLLEAMACGTPVVATAVSGVPEVMTAPEAGRLVHEPTPEAVAAAVRALLAAPPPRTATRAYAEGFSWEATSRGQLALFGDILGRPASAVSPSLSQASIA